MSARIPNAHLQTLPEFRKTKPVARGASKTCLELFEAYVKAVKPAQSTVNRWRVVFTTLDKHLDDQDIDTLSADDAQRWATSLVTDKRSRRTVSDVWVTAAKTVFAWALSEKQIAANPFADVSIRVPKKVINREDGKAFSPAEQQTILKAAARNQRHQTAVQGRLPLGSLVVCPGANHRRPIGCQRDLPAQQDTGDPCSLD